MGNDNQPDFPGSGAIDVIYVVGPGCANTVALQKARWPKHLRRLPDAELYPCRIESTWSGAYEVYGDAVWHYLEHFRPRIDDAHVFVRVHAPFGPLPSSGPISKLVRRAIERAGIKAPSMGAHVLRHSAAAAINCPQSSAARPLSFYSWRQRRPGSPPGHTYRFFIREGSDAILLSLNGDFADIVTYPPADYQGIIALQVRNHPEIIPQLRQRLRLLILSRKFCPHLLVDGRKWFGTFISCSLWRAGLPGSSRPKSRSSPQPTRS